jgi:hypothetical protein
MMNAIFSMMQYSVLHPQNAPIYGRGEGLETRGEGLNLQDAFGQDGDDFAQRFALLFVGFVTHAQPD